MHSVNLQLQTKSQKGKEKKHGKFMVDGSIGLDLT